jgi:hypothetical protein
MIKFGLKLGPNYNFNKYRNQRNCKQMEPNVIENQQDGDDISVINHPADNDALSSDSIPANEDVTMANNTVST